MNTAIRPSEFPWFDYNRYSFSLGLVNGDHVYLSGHSASEYDPQERRIVVRGGMADQTRTAYAKIARILDAAGRSWADVVRLVENVTLAGIEHYAEAEAVRTEVFGSHRPAVSTVVVNQLLRPAAWIEIEVVAGPVGEPVDDEWSTQRPACASARCTDGIVYLSSILALDHHGELVGDGNLASQTERIYDRAGDVLRAAGLSWHNVVKTTDFIALAAASDHGETIAVRKDRLVADYPAAAAIVMRRLRHPGALIQVDFMASTSDPVAVDLGSDRFAESACSPAVRAGDVLFISGQAAVDPDTGRAVHAGDVIAQAELAYENLARVLDAAGARPDDLVKTVEYVTARGLPDYRRVADVRRRLLREPWPASTGIICEALPQPDLALAVDPLAIVADR